MRTSAVYAVVTLVFLLTSGYASVPGDETYALTVRTGSHSDYLRIVLEGHHSILSKGKVRQEGKSVIVDLRGTKFKLAKNDLPVSHKVTEEAVTFYVNEVGRIKSFTLDNPDRLIIDIYKENKGDKKKPDLEIKKVAEKVVKNAQKAPADTARKIDASKIKKKETVTPLKDYDEVDLIPEQYKAMWTLLEAGNFYAVLKELPVYKELDSQTLGAYYYIYAKAHIIAKQYMDAIKYLRLAYIYATHDALKEHALITRAEMYMEIGFVYEARADYLMFIRDYPSSGSIEKAHHGLAESEYKIGLFKEAIKHYKQAGKGPAVLYSIANSLQKLKKTEEASQAYKTAMEADATYPERSPETFYLIGENMRLAGDTAHAKKQLLQIDSGPFQYKAHISLGLIAMDQSDTEEALRKFRSASGSLDQAVKVQALFNIALVHIKEGQFTEAAINLEEIRHKYMESDLYKDTLLILAKLYKKEGRLDESVFMLKELVYGIQPPAEVFGELEKLVLETENKSDGDNVSIVSLWNEIGKWLVDDSREEFLLKVAKRMRHEGKPFLELCAWLVRNASQSARGRAAINLADYYIGVGNVRMSEKYAVIAQVAGESGDSLLRVEAKILNSRGNQENALKKIMMIKNIEQDDLEQIGKILAVIPLTGSEEARAALDFYEEKLNDSDWDADRYLDLADILYANNDREKSLAYYRTAIKKNPDSTWAMYRVGRDTGRQESRDMFTRLQEEDNLMGRLAKTKLMEHTLMQKVEEVY